MKKIIIFLFILLFFEINPSLAENQTIILNITINVTNSNQNIFMNDIFCNVSINISINQTLFDNDKKITFYNHLSNDSFYYEIEYWIEDLFGRIVKKKVITSNKNKKTYTPKIDDEDRILIIKNKIFSLNCSNVNNKTSSEKIILIKNRVIEELPCEKSKFGSSSVCEPKIIIQQVKVEENKAKIKSFYTRTSKFHEKIKTYSNIEGEGNYDVILSSFDERINKNISLNSSTTFSFNVSAIKGKNVYFLELYEQNKLLDFKKLDVEFENSEEKIINQTLLKQTNFEEIRQNKTNYSIKTTENVIYESDGEKRKSRIVYFLFLPFIVLLVILIIKKRF